MKNTKREEQKKLEDAVLAETLTSNFIQELGSKARVERTKIDNERMDALREVVKDIALDLLEVGAVPKGLRYRGSLCVHVYTSDILRSAAFATTSFQGTLTADLADGALRELNGSTMERFGKARQKLRSGF